MGDAPRIKAGLAKGRRGKLVTNGQTGEIERVQAPAERDETPRISEPSTEWRPVQAAQRTFD